LLEKESEISVADSSKDGGKDNIFWEHKCGCKFVAKRINNYKTWQHFKYCLNHKPKEGEI
jgi:hypothetical protein